MTSIGSGINAYRKDLNLDMIGGWVTNKRISEFSSADEFHSGVGFTETSDTANHGAWLCGAALIVLQLAQDRQKLILLRHQLAFEVCLLNIHLYLPVKACYRTQLEQPMGLIKSNLSGTIQNSLRNRREMVGATIQLDRKSVV